MKKNDLTKNTALLMIGTLLNKGLLFVMIPLFSRWLSTEDYGIFDILCTYVTLLIPLVTLATSDAMFRYLVDCKSNEDKCKIVTNNFVINFVNLLILTFILILIYIFTSWNLAIPFLILAIGEIVNNHLQGYMRGIKKLNIYSLCMALSTALIALFSTIFIKVCGFGLLGIIYGYALGFIVCDILIVVITKYFKFLKFKFFSFDIIKELIKYSFPLIFNNISWWVVNVSDRTIINLFLNSTMNGIYAIANKVPSLCSSVFGMFSISWQQTASEMKDDKNRNEYFNLVFNKMISLLVPLCALIISANFILFDYIFDSKYNIARYHAPILVFSIIFYSLSQFLGGIQISFKRPKENGITTVIGAIVNIAINLSLIKFIGLYAASISTLVSNVVLFSIRKIRLNKDVKLKINFKNYFAFVIFALIFVIQYFKINTIISAFISMFVTIYFVLVNNEYLFKILKKMHILK